MLKLTLKIAMVMLIMTGCGGNADDKDFDKFAQDFYIQMLTDGEQSEEVSEMYDEMVSEYNGVENETLYENLAGMYEALGGEGDAEQYRQQVTKILNEGVE
jgi:hypothetical protein